MGGHEFAYFAVVIEHGDAWCLGLREAAEGDASWELVGVRHLVVGEDVALGRLEGVDVEDSASDIFSLAGSSLVSFLGFDKERLPLLEVAWFFDGSVLEDDVTVVLELL